MRMIPLEKQSKKARRAFYEQMRGSWNGVNPVTRTVPGKKTYDRNRMKREQREDTPD